MRFVPTAASVTSPASLSTFRCWDTAGLDTGNSSASCPTAIGSRARHSKIARLVGSPSAPSAAAPLVSTYRKLRLTEGKVKAGGLEHARAARPRRSDVAGDLAECGC